MDPFHTLKTSHLQKSKNPKLTPQTIRTLFTGWTSRRWELVPTKTTPWAVIDNLEAVIGPHEKGQRQETTIKAIKLPEQVSLGKLTVVKNVSWT